MAICRVRAHWTPDVKNMSRWQDFVRGTGPLNNNSWDTLWISCNEISVTQCVGCSNVSWNKLHLFSPKFKNSFTTFLRTRHQACVQCTTESSLKELRNAALGAKELIRLLMHCWHLNENVMCSSVYSRAFVFSIYACRVRARRQAPGIDPLVVQAT